MAKVDVKRRDDQFSDKIETAIWKEKPSLSNPFHAEEIRCFGYDHLALVNKKSFAEVFFLLFRGELPDEAQRTLFESLLISVIHPGPRHVAARAAMNAAVSKTHVSHILPLSMNVMAGEWQGSREVFQAMKFLSRNLQSAPEGCARDRLSALSDTDKEGDLCVAPGFGSSYGTADTYAQKLADNLFAHCVEGESLHWARQFVACIEESGAGWRVTGLFAATLCDLGFTPYQGELLYQIATAPGIAAQAAEKSDQPITAMPFVSDQNYTIEGE